jgi:hypothetical protein
MERRHGELVKEIEEYAAKLAAPHEHFVFPDLF